MISLVSTARLSPPPPPPPPPPPYTQGCRSRADGSGQRRTMARRSGLSHGSLQESSAATLAFYSLVSLSWVTFRSLDESHSKE